MCASTVGSLSSGGSIGLTLATTVGVGTAFLANTASVNRNFEEARNELHGIEERMENGFAEARKERHEIMEKMKTEVRNEMENGFMEVKKVLQEAKKKKRAEDRLSNIEFQLRMERLMWHSVGPGAKIEITKDINELEEQKASLEREIGQLEALESGQERQVSGSLKLHPCVPHKRNGIGRGERGTLSHLGLR
eukprot:scaffold17828_cov122-Cylindrotheca_fusiformis.AAC.2